MSERGGIDDAARRASHRAFTLLEVLITAILLATLLAGIWSLYQTFGALYDTGFVQTEKALMVRSLTQQIAEDLRGTIAPAAALGPPPPRSASDELPPVRDNAATPSCAARVGLVGTYNTLRLDVLQTDPPFTTTPPPEESSTLEDETAGRDVGEIATVLYSFVPPAMTETDLLAAQPGLTRREIRINQSSADEMRLAESLDGAPSGIQYSSGGSWQSTGIADTAPEANAYIGSSYPAPPVITRLPEVVALEFRYFDGAEWTDAWDARARKSLPCAVEVSFEVAFADESKPHAAAATAPVPLVEAGSQGAAGNAAAPSNSPASAGERATGYRFVVYLPQSALLKPETRFRPAPRDEPADVPLDEEPPPGGGPPPPANREAPP